MAKNTINPKQTPEPDPTPDTSPTGTPVHGQPPAPGSQGASESGNAARQQGDGTSDINALAESVLIQITNANSGANSLFAGLMADVANASSRVDDLERNVVAPLQGDIERHTGQINQIAGQCEENRRNIGGLSERIGDAFKRIGYLESKFRSLTQTYRPPGWQPGDPELTS